MSDPKTLFLIDGHALAYRMFFAFQKQNLSADGKPTGAIYGFVTALLRIIDTYQPTYLGVVFDPPGKTFRNDMYADYKATRQKMPEELRDQIPHISTILQAMNCFVIDKEGYEADDVMGTLARRFEGDDLDVVLYTGDKDFMQLVSDHIKLLKPGMRGNDDQWIGFDEVRDKFDVTPEQVIEALALIGDTSDNVPGVDGVGEKTAGKLLAKYGSLDRILDEPEKISHKRAREFLSQPGNVEMIRLSRQLVTIDTDVPLSVTLQDFTMDEPDNAALFEMFKNLKFRTLLSRFAPEDEQLGFNFDAPPPDEAAYHAVTTLEQLVQLIEKLKSSGGFAFDTETTNPDPMRAKVVGISFAVAAGEAWYVPVGHVEKGTFENESPDLQAANLPADKAWERLKPLLEDEAVPKFAHNMKYDVLVLANDVGIEVTPFSFDTMIAAWVLDPARRQNGLKELALELLNHKMSTYEEMVGKGKDQINFAEVEIAAATQYGAEDSDFTIRLKTLLEPDIDPAGLTKLFEKIEMPLVPVLTRMERAGVSIDPDFFSQMSDKLSASLGDLEKHIYEIAGEEFNINSTKQLREIFFDKLKLRIIKKTPKGDPSTAVDVLEELAKEHDLPARIIDYRELSKLKGTYVDALPKMINPATGRIHTSYNQTVAPTGRLSTSDPGLQNIPIRTELGREIRKGFVPGPGYDLLLAADYSQIELRVLAHFAGDSALREAFERGEDIHARTAAAVFGCDIADVTPEMRRTAKTTNFGIIYGQTPYGLSNALGISVGEARDFIDRYFDTYPGVKSYIEGTIEQARDDGFVRTLFGRRRPLPDIKAKNRNVREYAERTAINTPIQGTAADMIKLAMIGIDAKLRQMGVKSRMILQVHDELIFEMVASEMDAVQAMIIEQMETALPLDVPIKVDVGTGASWFEAH